MNIPRISLAGKNGVALALVLVGVALLIISKWLGGWFAVIGLLLIIATLLENSIVQIEAEETGAQKIFGKASTRVLKPGLRWIIPFFTQIKRVSTMKETYRHTEEGIDPGDGFKFGVDYTIFAEFNPLMVYLFAKKLHLPIDENYFVEFMKKILHDVYIRFSCDELRTDVGSCRAVVQSEVNTKFMDMVDKELGLSLFSEISLIIKDYHFDPDYLALVERVNRAKKEAEAAEAEKRARIIKAEALKESLILEGQGEAESIRAKGEAQNEVLDERGRILTEKPAITHNDAAQRPPETLVLGAGVSPVMDINKKLYPVGEDTTSSSTQAPTPTSTATAGAAAGANVNINVNPTPPTP